MFCYCIAFFTSCKSVATISTTDLPGIALKYKLLKNFALSTKIPSCLITTFFKTFPRYKSKTIKQYNLGLKQIPFPKSKKL